MEKELEIGIGHFNRKEFFEAHEAWERIWLHAGEEKLFLQGLIQIAVGYYHHLHKNPEGAMMLLERGSSYVSKYPDGYMGISSGKLIKDALSSVKKIEENKKCSLSPPKIQKIKKRLK